MSTLVLLMRLCFFGDSFVNGTGDPEHLGWVGRICAERHRAGRDLTAYNLGVRRDTSADIRARWHTEAVARLPDDVEGRLIFSFGVNDCVLENGSSRLAMALSLEHASAILRVASGWRPTLFIGPPPIADDAINRRIAELSSALADLCSVLGTPYLDTFSALQRTDCWLTEVAAGDGAHPGAGGYVELARIVSEWSAWQAWF